MKAIYPYSLDTVREREYGLPRFEVWQAIRSTNDRARELAVEGSPRGSLVLGWEQTEGRGRHGSLWFSAAGDGVWMSLVLGANDVTTHLPILVGISCAEVIEEMTGVIVSIKWPNDLIINGRKVGGVLVEMGDGWVVAGIGINVRRSPSESLQAFDDRALPATSIAEHSDQISENPDFAGRFAQRILERLDARKGRDGVVDSFSARDILRDLQVHTDELGSGIARGIDECGMLLLELEDGAIVKVRSGSVRAITSSEEEE